MRFGMKILPQHGDRIGQTKYAYLPTRVFIGKKPNGRQEEGRALIWVWLETYEVEQTFKRGLRGYSYDRWETVDKYVN